MLQMGRIGPITGQASVFHRYFPEKLQPAITRYQHEGRRLFGVLGYHFGGSKNGWSMTIRSPTLPTGAEYPPINGQVSMRVVLKT